MDVRTAPNGTNYRSRQGIACLFGTIALCALSGCWAPLHSPGVPANTLPECFRTPYRTAGPPLNFANLTARVPPDYYLGPDDILEITIPELYLGQQVQPLRVQIMANGEVQLPMVGAVAVGGKNLLQAQQAITAAYADGYIKEPRINVALAQKATVDIVILGEVQAPGVHPLPKYQNDVAHAIAAAGGLTPNAGFIVEVHRRVPSEYLETQIERAGLEYFESNPDDPKSVVRIPLRGLPPGMLSETDVILHPGDVVVVPSRQHEVFFVVGRLSTTNLIRFTLGDRDRELGAGLVLPRDREIDVVTAVTMAGYIDPIESPTTVTVHRVLPNGEPLLIHVDLIAARYDRRETVLVQPGDIIYLNPDAPWYFRRVFDRVVGDIIVLPYAKLIGRPD